MTPPPSSAPPIDLISDIPLAPKAMTPFERPRFRTGSGIGPRAGAAMIEEPKPSMRNGALLLWTGLAVAVVAGVAVLVYSLVTVPRASSPRSSSSATPTTTTTIGESTASASDTITPPSSSASAPKKPKSSP